MHWKKFIVVICVLFAIQNFMIINNSLKMFKWVYKSCSIFYDFLMLYRTPGCGWANKGTDDFLLLYQKKGFPSLEASAHRCFTK